MGDAPVTNTGPGRTLIAVYALFAVAATARSAYQIATRFDEAPMPFLLSAVAAAVYLVATVALARPGPTAYRVAVAAVLVELAGVLVVGSVTAFGAGTFPRDTVWSDFGRGYGFVPLVLPFVGLWWLRRSRIVMRS
ncbi:MAG TPA: hypothetical protein VFY84_06350 [Jiangellales bacterium]|nr:hypothetical protein [Jiangellales bacterium]